MEPKNQLSPEDAQALVELLQKSNLLTTVDCEQKLQAALEEVKRWKERAEYLEERMAKIEKIISDY